MGCKHEKISVREDVYTPQLWIVEGEGVTQKQHYAHSTGVWRFWCCDEDCTRYWRGNPSEREDMPKWARTAYEAVTDGCW